MVYWWGSSLIEGAKNRAQATQLERLTTAMNTFRLKYNALPADISSPERFGFYKCLGCDFSMVHNGNGLLNDYLGNVPIVHTWGDPYFVFMHLSDARLIEGRFAEEGFVYSYCDLSGHSKQFVKMKIGNGGIVAGTYMGGVWWYLGLNICSTTNQSLVSQLSTAGVLTPEQAYQLDSKFDDGKPGTGNIRAVTHTSGALDTTDGNCVASSASQYNISKTTRECRLYAKAQ